MSSPIRVAMVALFAFLLLPSIPQAGPPAPRCIPSDGFEAACQGNTGYVGPGACVSIFACANNSGDIGRNGCVGTIACSGNQGYVGADSCQGHSSCAGNTGNVSGGS